MSKRSYIVIVKKRVTLTATSYMLTLKQLETPGAPFTNMDG